MRQPYLVRPATPGRSCICTHCGQPATMEALFRSPGAILIEKYCDRCLEPETFQMLMRSYAANGS